MGPPHGDCHTGAVRRACLLGLRSGSIEGPMSYKVLYLRPLGTLGLNPDEECVHKARRVEVTRRFFRIAADDRIR